MMNWLGIPGQEVQKPNELHKLNELHKVPKVKEMTKNGNLPPTAKELVEKYGSDIPKDKLKEFFGRGGSVAELNGAIMERIDALKQKLNETP